MIAVDTNILVYARRAEMPLHRAAMAQLVALAEGEAPWALPVPCAVEFFRVVTHDRIFQPPTTPRAALAFVSALLESPTVRFIGGAPRFWSLFGALVEEGGIRGNLAFDAQIAAVCIEHGATEIVTEDRDFKRFAGIRVRTLPLSP